MKDILSNFAFILVLMVFSVAFAPAESATDIPDAQIEMVVDMELTETVQTDVVRSDFDQSDITFLHISAPEEPVIIDKHYLQAEELNYRQIENIIYNEPHLTTDKWPCRCRLI